MRNRFHAIFLLVLLFITSLIATKTISGSGVDLADGLYSYFPMEDKNDILGFAVIGQTATVSYTPGLIGNALNVPTDVNQSMIYFGDSIGDRDDTYRDVLYNDATVNVWVNVRSFNSITDGGMIIVSGNPAEREEDSFWCGHFWEQFRRP